MGKRENTLQRESIKRLGASFRGWICWHRLIRKYDLNGKNAKTAVVLLPRNDDENCFYALLYLDRMLSLRHFNAALLLSASSEDAEIVPLFSKKVLAVEVLDDCCIEALMQYYELMQFDARLIVTSLEEPNGRNGRALVGTCGITAEEIVAIGVYRIVPYVQKKRPFYHGDNQRIREFMQVAVPYSGKRTERVIQ